MASGRAVPAAGAVVWRRATAKRADGMPGPGDTQRLEVLLVHRPRYDDWSFPKGKLDPGEHPTAAAVREVAEETGVQVRLGVPLQDQHYPLAAGGAKQVCYWAAQPVAGDPSLYRPNAEIDEVAWVPVQEGAERLSYDRDRVLLEQFTSGAIDTTPLIVLRHAQAEPRRGWREPDVLRPLDPAGTEQAAGLVPQLAAYATTAVISSVAVRCRDTVRPFADKAGLDVRTLGWLSEEGVDPGRITRLVRGLLKSPEPTVVCSHRPVLPHLFAALGVRDPGLPPGGYLVAHHGAGVVRATERPG